MALAAGTRLGPYEILSAIGAGGMGEVYAARDQRLGRSVAIKTIRNAHDSQEARTRFWQEARSPARICHPRICQIFDVDEDGGILFLVLELLEGQSLESRLKTGPVPLDETLRITHEMLEALEALHNLGIVHRDLKPSNVFLTPHGVKTARLRPGSAGGSFLGLRSGWSHNHDPPHSPGSHCRYSLLHGAGAD